MHHPESPQPITAEEQGVAPAMATPSLASFLHAAPDPATTSGASGAGLGAAVLMLMLAAGIFVGLNPTPDHHRTHRL